MRCPECDYEYPLGLRYCGRCGARVASICENCGFANPLDYLFCGHCGIRLADSSEEGARWIDRETSPEAAADTDPGGGPPVVQDDAETAQPAEELRQQRTEAEPVLLQLEGERRTVTVMMADVQGSTNLFERIGTEAWVSMMNRVFQILETEIYRYGGEVDQFRGDGLVAFFGATSAHEDDPERAILAGLAMQSALQSSDAELSGGAMPSGESDWAAVIDLKLRVGVNTGEVIVANIGDSRRHSEDTAMGEAIALADRMEKAAEAGTVLVSENTYLLAQDRFEWRALGEISVKGVSRPVAVYRPLGPRTDGDGRGLSARSLGLETYGLSPLLVGRDREFAVLTDLIRAVRDDHGGVVLLTASEGLGKSHVVAMVRQHVARDEALLAEAEEAFRPLTWLWGQCRSYEQTWPYSMWLDLGRRWLGVREAEPTVQVRERLHEKTQALWGERMDEYYPYLARMLSLPLEEPFSRSVEGLGAAALRQAFFRAVRSWVEAMAKKGPLVLVFEDVHWADAASVELLEHCLPVCDRMGVLWVISTRSLPGEGGPDTDQSSPLGDLERRFGAACPHRLTSLSLSPLTEAESSEMIDRLIGPAVLPPETHACLVERAEGNPYYIQEFIRSLIRSGVLVREAEKFAWRGTDRTGENGSASEGKGRGEGGADPVPLELPDTLRSLLLARMDDLALEERRVLQVAAVIGAVFWEDVLFELVGQECDIEQCLAALQRARFVREAGRTPYLGTEYHFESSLIRDAAYEGLLSAQRSRYHRRVAEHLARPSGDGILAQYYGLVAYHFRHARERRRELFYTLAAAEHAQEIYANAEALEYYTRALRLLDELGQDETTSPGRLWHDWRLETLRGLGQVHYGTGRVVEAEKYFREAISLAEEMGADPEYPLAVTERVRLYYWLCETLYWQHRHGEQIDIAQEGLSLLAQEAGLAQAPESVETALMNQEIAAAYLRLGDRARFQDYTRRTASFLRDLPYSEELRPAYDHVAIMYARDAKDPAQATQWLEALERFATPYHDLRALGDVHDHRAWILNHSGDARGAIVHLCKAVETFDEIGDASHKVRCLNDLAETYFSLGDLRQAQECARRELEVAVKAQDVAAIASAHLHLGRVHFCEGEGREAVDALQEAIRLAREAEDRWKEGNAAYALARILLAQRDRSGALERYREAMDHLDPEILSQDSRLLALVLSVSEEAHGDLGAFQACCARWRQEVPQLAASPLVKWYLEPSEIGVSTFGSASVFRDDFAVELDSGWLWQDPMDDCWFRVRRGLEVRASNRRAMWHINLSAPRVLRPASGNWAVQTVCSRVADEGAGVPASGGLLLWGDAESYVWLDVGTAGRREVRLGGCIDDVDLVVGRGQLPQTLSQGGEARPATPPFLEGEIHLRLERVVDAVRGLCSVDGVNWFSVGQIKLSGDGSLQVGLYANGDIDRLIYPGAYPEGTAICFGSFEMWGGDGQNLRPSAP